MMDKEYAHRILKVAYKNPECQFSSERTEDGQMIAVAVTGDRRRVIRKDKDITIASAKAYEAWRAGCVA